MEATGLTAAERQRRLHAVRPGGFIRRDWSRLVHDETNRTGILRHEVAGACQVAVPPLPGPAPDWTGTRQSPDRFAQDGSYLSAEVAWYVVPRAIVHSSAGLIVSAPFIVASSLQHTGQDRSHYDALPDGSVELRTTRLRAQTGTAFSLLAGGHHNYYHWMIDGLGRLAALRDIMARRPGPLLVPPLGTGFRRQMLALVDWIDPDRLLEVADDETVAVERLIAPGSVSGVGWSVHPAMLAEVFQPMAARAPVRPDLPRRFYIERLGSLQRRMLNEPALISGLGLLGLPAVRLESLTAAEQVSLFAQAELIVAPHGAGLTNLVFAPPGCRVIEILMGSYVNWCFRVIAALARVEYRAIVVPHQAGDRPIHAATWQVDVPAVMRAVAGALTGAWPEDA